MTLLPLASAFMAMLLLALLVAPIAERLGLSASAGTMVVGALAGALISHSGFDTGLRWNNFEPLIRLIFIPALVFSSAVEMEPGAIRRNLGPVFLLAIPATIVAAAVITVTLFIGVGHSTGFPWIAAGLTAVILVSTDPAAVYPWIRQLPGGGRCCLLLEGESVFNDALAIVAFDTLLAVALHAGETEISVIAATVQTLAAFAGGVAIGWAAGAILIRIARPQQDSRAFALLAMLVTYLIFYLTDGLLSWSGVMAVLTLGLVIRSGVARARYNLVTASHTVVWRFMAYVANALVFLLAGLTVTFGMFTAQWVAVLIAIFAVLIARVVSIYGCCLVGNRVGMQAISLREQGTLLAGGTRGVVTLALALSLSPALGYWFTSQSMAYGVVLFSVFLQMPLVRFLTRHRR